METPEMIDDLSEGAKLGLWALGGVIGGIIAWDCLNTDDTISSAIRAQHDKHPILGRAVTLTALTGLAIHLCLDEDTDPIQRAFTNVTERVREWVNDQN